MTAELNLSFFRNNVLIMTHFWANYLNDSMIKISLNRNMTDWQGGDSSYCIYDFNLTAFLSKSQFSMRRFDLCCPKLHVEKDLQVDLCANTSELCNDWNHNGQVVEWSSRNGKTSQRERTLKSWSHISFISAWS